MPHKDKIVTGGNGGKKVNPKKPNPKKPNPKKPNPKKPKPKKPKPRPKKPKPKKQETMIATGGRGGQRKRKGTG